MDKEYYPMIFKRKSFHLFRNTGNECLQATEIKEIQNAYDAFEPLYKDIQTAIRIVPSSYVNFKRDAEYCILIYSEKKENYLMNAGYLGEQLDLYLTSRNIGTLWFGIGKPDEYTFEGLEYVIMLAIHKMPDATYFRKDMYKAKRKPVEDVWTGETYGIAEVVRFAPSACNSQPWLVQNKDGVLTIQRYKKNSRIGIMSPKAASYFNRIDIGIFLCILEICLSDKNVKAVRELFSDEGDKECTTVARYTLTL